ncbi:MAG: aminopeptidase N [Gammaproteobacteria bacterium]|nr:aminopeptidase N [Gammaproteobacteria bacterium]
MTTKTKEPQTRYREDYQPSAYLIDKINLSIDVHDDVTVVTSHLSVKRSSTATKVVPLVLNGEGQKLNHVKLNQQLLTEEQYQLDDRYLTLKNVPDVFELEIQSEIKPQENTALLGLYQSNELLCTQCESEGFRRITYFLDRPDVLSKFTTKIIADPQKYPILLSNGNLIEQGKLEHDRHFAVWQDPFPKPCYLFAMVAGDLDRLEDYFVTRSGRKVTLRIYSEKGNQEKCRFAMSSIKKAMRWDEENYGREYDLDIFMIVAVRDFNYGAMENKGLNIFNEKYILANPEIATDADYQAIDEVIAHEYFHNWTGDRVTCRDWFQLCLKEGLTVFRDQSFSKDVTSPGVRRIEEVDILRTRQFAEDRSPLAHPIRPDSYIEIDNFYTATVYEKGAEVIRMMQTLLGKEKFRRGMDLYFERHDGQAVTCEDFIKAMEDANQYDLTQFRRWYSQAGTPHLKISTRYDAPKKAYKITLHQTCPPTPGQPKKMPFHIPFKMALLDSRGKLIPKSEKLLEIKKAKETFIFENIHEKPIPSLLRAFSAPVMIDYNYGNEALLFLIEHDTDPFARWEAMQKYAVKLIFSYMNQGTENTVQLENLLAVFKNILTQKMEQPEFGVEDDLEFLAELLILPSETYLAELMDTVDVDGIHAARKFIKKQIAIKLKNEWQHLFDRLNIFKPYEYNQLDVAKRCFKNLCLNYINTLDTKHTRLLCVEQFHQVKNMTDRMAVLSALNESDYPEREISLTEFYEAFKSFPSVIDKWFAIQSQSSLIDVFVIKELLEHPDFNIRNPNRVRSILGVFSVHNPTNFHAKDGSGYQLIADYVLQLDKINAHMAANLLKPLTQWQRFDQTRQKLMKRELNRILKTKGISNNVYEIAKKGLLKSIGLSS